LNDADSANGRTSFGIMHGGLWIVGATQIYAPPTIIGAKLHVRRSIHSMPGHKFHIGEIVELSSSVRWASGGVYEVTKRLPENAGEYEYRVKSIKEPHERVVRESELFKA
jgi:hypothetical protein